MFPVGDDTERRLTPLLAPLLAVAAVFGAVAMLIAGHAWSAASILVGGWWMQVYGAGLESLIGRARFALIAGLGAGAGCLLAAAVADDRRLVVAAVAGATSAVVTAHLLRRRGGQILSAQLLPPFTSFVALPAWLWALVWAALTGAFVALGAFRVSA